MSLDTLSPETLRRIMPRLSVERAIVFAPLLTETCSEFGIEPPAAVAMFLAQAAHESSELRRLREDLNYSAAGLRVTFPARFSASEAARYARKPELIASRAYANRYGNGDEASGDGWRYRGRGVFQLTFRANYRAAGQALGLPLEDEPDLVATPPVACRTAGWYWQSRGLTPLAVEGDLRAVTRRINSALLGLAEREIYWNRAKQALGVPAMAGAA